MKIFVLFSMSLAVAVGIPLVNPDVLQHPILTEDQRPLVGDWLPKEGHVVVEEPAPHPKLKEAEEREKKENIQVEEKPQVKDEPQLQAQPDFKVELDVKEKPDDKKPEQGPEAIPGDKVDPEPRSPDFKVESEIKVEPESQDKTEFEAKTETGLEVEEKHIDMEGTYEKMDQPIMYLKDDDVKNEEKQNDKERTNETMDQPTIHLEPINDEDEDAKNKEEQQFDMDKTYETMDQPTMHLEPRNDEDEDVKNEEEKPIDKERTYETMDQPTMHLEPKNDEDEDVKNEEEQQTDMERTYETMDQPTMHLEPRNDEDEDVKNEEEKPIDKERTYETMDQPTMHLEPKNDEDEDVKNEEEQQTDMERTYETMDQPTMHFEPMNDEDAAKVDSEHEMSEEELLDAEEAILRAFENSDPAADEQHLPEEEDALAEKNNDAVTISEPEVSSDQEQLMPGGYMMDEGPRLDALGEPMLPLDEYFPNEEDFIGSEPEIQQNPLTVDMMMRENPEQEFVDGEYVMDAMPMMDETEINGDYQSKRGRGYYPGCAGVVLQGKCYVFYKGPKRAEEAEFFCQRSATRGHLASITNEHIHREVMRLMLETNGAYTRTWIGGLRYLGTGRFVWLDGEHWGYADWLSGEPNNTADKEDCVEVLAHGFGKFNDFTCWEPQAFVCSYPYQ